MSFLTKSTLHPDITHLHPSIDGISVQMAFPRSLACVVVGIMLSAALPPGSGAVVLRDMHIGTLVKPRLPITLGPLYEAFTAQRAVKGLHPRMPAMPSSSRQMAASRLVGLHVAGWAETADEVVRPAVTAALQRA